MAKKGHILLENGERFSGISFGAEKDVSGELVFNTGMVGYPEGFTDPSYAGQILNLTYPLIGNYGVPLRGKEQLPHVFESERIQILGLLVSSYEDMAYHWQARETLSQWLNHEGVPALMGIDTRTITQIIREHGAMKAVLTFSDPPHRRVSFTDPNKENLVAGVSTKTPATYGKGKLRILLFDCGVKMNQIRLLVAHGATVIRVPWDFDPLAHPDVTFDAVMISNGPGDPKMADKTVATVKELMKKKIPVLGVCLGNQILALAAGANTYKLPFGHRGQNQPVQDEKTGKCFVTTQNHGFAVETKSLPAGWEPWFTNLNDRTNEGIRHTSLPFISTQFHPESAPGPTDTEWVFPYFIEMVHTWKNKSK